MHQPQALRLTSSFLLRWSMVLVLLVTSLGFGGWQVRQANAASSATTTAPKPAVAPRTIKPTATAFTPGDLVVYRVGTGSPALSSAGTAVFLDEYTPAGTLVQSIPLPTAASGPNHAMVASGSATSEGLLTLSTDGRYLVTTGYSATVGITSLPGTASVAVPRVVGRVDALGNIDTSTALTNYSTGNNIRSATSTSGTNIWIGGPSGSAAGLAYTTLGSSTVVTYLVTGLNTRQVNIFNGQLYASSASNNFQGINIIGSGTPTSSNQLTVLLTGSAAITTTSPYGFYFADLSTSVPGVDTLYVADDNNGTPATGGIIKYSLVGGTWISNGKAGTASSAYRGLTGVTNGTTVTLYATANGTSLVSLSDTNGYNSAFSSTAPILLAPAGTNTAFRGVALVPSNGKSSSTISLTSSPNPSNFGDSVNFTATVTPLTATGIVTFTFDGAASVTTTLTSGVASYITSTLSVGNHPVVVAYEGDTNVNAGVSNTLTQTVLALPPASITVSGGNNQSTTVSTVFGSPLSATVLDSNSTPVAGQVVTFTAPVSGASGTFAGGSTVYTGTTNASGIVTAPAFTANSIAGTYTVTADVGFSVTPVSFTLTNTAGAATQLLATSGDGQSATVGTAFASPLVATVLDSANNPVAGQVVTFTAPVGGANGRFSGGQITFSGTTDASGIVTTSTFTAMGSLVAILLPLLRLV